MKEYIEIIECRDCESKNCYGCNILTLAEMLNNGAFDGMMDDHHSIIPAAEVVERKRGRWIEHDCFKCNSNGDPVIKTGTVFVCSECGREELHREPFCHCGADMREEG